MQWKAFKDEIPNEGRMVIIANHRMAEVIRFSIHHPLIKDNLLAFKPITHWEYLILPPPEAEETKW